MWRAGRERRREGEREGGSHPQVGIYKWSWSTACYTMHKVPTQGPFPWLLFGLCTMPDMAWVVDTVEALVCTPAP